MTAPAPPESDPAAAPSPPPRPPRSPASFARTVLWVLAAAMLLAWLLEGVAGPRRAATPTGGIAVMGPITMNVKAAVPAGSGTDVSAAVDAAVEEARRINALLSYYNDQSEVSRINASAGEGWIRVSPETGRVLAEALRHHRLSGGAFDVTVGPLVDLYKPIIAAARDGDGPTALPDPAWRDAALERVGSRFLHLGPGGRRVRLERPRMRIDLGALAKGYAVDRAVAVLREHGVTQGSVEIGGDMRVFGGHPDGRPWRVSVTDPRPAAERSGEPLRVLERDAAALATSGDYEQFFVVDGVRHGHIVDPRTGLPVTGDLVGVTVLAPTCLQADALATALIVLGPDEGRRLIDLFPGVEAVFQFDGGADGIRIEHYPAPADAGGSEEEPAEPAE